MIQPSAPDTAPATGISTRRLSSLLQQELAEHLRQNRAYLLEEWARRIKAAPMRVIRKRDLLARTALVYDDYVTAVAAGRVETLRSYFARHLPGHFIARGVDPREIFRVTALLDDMLAGNSLDRSLFARFRHA